jgi:hypothetical protein
MPREHGLGYKRLGLVCDEFEGWLLKRTMGSMSWMALGCRVHKALLFAHILHGLPR